MISDMIKIKNLSVCYKGKKVNAIENVNINIEKGQICTVVGPSGVGKSTILKVLAGIIKNYEGESTIDGEEVNPTIHSIGFIPQNYGLVEWKTIKQNIYLSAKVKNGTKNIDNEFYKKLLDKLNIGKQEKCYPRNLSGGEKQRVSIARAFLLKPKLLLMDEPFSALDVVTREDARRLFLDVWNEHKVTTILVTHDIKEAIYLGQKIIVMSSSPGEIVKCINNDLFGKSYTLESEVIENMAFEIKEMFKRGI